MNREWLFALILVASVFLAYQPVWYAGFIWDDDAHLTDNPCIIGPLGLKEIWIPSAGHFFPLVLTTFWLIHAMWGLAPLPYHLANVLLHAASGIVLWRILRHLLVPGAWLGAALWALHPLQVESVAWISEMKNTQSGLFYLLTILFYVRWLRADKGGWNYALCLLFAALALASKSSAIVLLGVLPLCAWWVEGQWRWRHLLPIVPIVPMVAAAVAVTVWPQPAELASLPDLQWSRTWWERVATSGDVIWFYLEKLAWPHPLMAIYPRWQIDASQWTSYVRLAAVAIVLLILGVKRESWSRACLFALLYFLVVLAPFLGLLDQSFWRFSFVEDHLQYLAGMGPLALLGAGLVRAADLLLGRRRWLQTSFCAGLLLLLGIVSWNRTWAYESEEVLWADTLAKNPNAWLAHNNFGNELLKKGEVDGAIDEFEEALAINPNYDMAHFSLGNGLVQKGQLDQAMVEYQEAVRITPSLGKALSNMGSILFQKGQVDEAIVEYQKAVGYDPYYALARRNLGYALLQKGRVDEAIEQFEMALEINPSDAQARTNLAIAEARKGK